MMDTLIGILPNGTNVNKNWKGEIIPNKHEVTSIGNTINISDNSNLINSDNSTSILDENLNIIENENRINETPIHLKPTTTTIFQYFKKQKEESASFLIGATKINTHILEFDNPIRFPALENLIGINDFQKIKPVLLKFIEAKKWIN